MGVKSDIIDAYFVECAKAVEAGELVAAKAPAGGGDKGVGVLICYTKDFRDRAQAERSGVALKRRFGCGIGLKYKTDSATYEGMYATKGGKGWQDVLLRDEERESEDGRRRGGVFQVFGAGGEVQTSEG